MSIDTLRLDPDRISQLEPSEGNERELFMLSPFSVPVSVVLYGSPDQGFDAMVFNYAAREDSGEQETLQGPANLIVYALLSKHSQKVLKLALSRPVPRDELGAVASALRMRARSKDKDGPVSRRLSYQMIASILENWGPDLFFRISK